jgi:murein DD-endopeptidase MepM/ murein hydrolase activator NlpD
MKRYFLLILSFSALQITFSQKEPYVSREHYYPRYYKTYAPIYELQDYIADKISYPVNHGNMQGYHDANPFQRFSYMFYARHLGADINGNEMGDSDLGDTIYAIGNGIVTIQIGSIIQILHNTPFGYIVSQYRHCRDIFMKIGQKVKHLQAIGTIGNEDGAYLNAAHLHFEIRTNIFLDILGGYGDPEGFVDPMKFIEDFNKKHLCSTMGAEICYEP